MSDPKQNNNGEMAQIHFDMQIAIGHEGTVEIPMDVVKKGRKSIEGWLNDNQYDEALDYGIRDTNYFYFVEHNDEMIDLDGDNPQPNQ